MLSGLKAGAPVYVFNKNLMQIFSGKVTSVSKQYPQYNFNQLGGMNQNYAVVDLVVDIEGKSESFPKIPITSVVAEFPDKNMLISETREGALNEVSAIRTLNQSEIDRVPEREEIVKKCDFLLLEWNPQLKKEKEQAEEIAGLKSKIDLLMQKIDSMTAASASRTENS